MGAKPLQALITAIGVLIAIFSFPATAIGAGDPDYDLPGGKGHFYKQANGQGGQGELGFAITNDGGIPFWDEYRRLGGPDVLGYPVSRRFVWDGFTVQATQKAVLQWRPESNSFAFANVLDRMHELRKDDWLLTSRQIPKQFDNSADIGLSWQEVIKRHITFLEGNRAIRERFLSNPSWLDHYGLPVSYGDFGNCYVVRAQRAVFQYWKEEVPWARKGEVTVANAGDLAKEAGLFPSFATAPELPPGAAQAVTQPYNTVPGPHTLLVPSERTENFGPFNVWSSYLDRFGG